MSLNNDTLIAAIKIQSADKPACVLTIYRWFFGKAMSLLTDGSLKSKIHLLENEGFKFSLAQVFSTGKKPRYLRTDLMVGFPGETNKPLVLGGRVPFAMIAHLDQHVGLRVYKADSEIEEEEEVA